MKEGIRNQLWLAVLLLVSPLLMYFYILVPNKEINIDFLGIVLKFSKYETAYIFCYYLCVFLFPVVLLIAWYLNTANKKISLVILLVLVFYLSKLYSIILDLFFNDRMIYNSVLLSMDALSFLLFFQIKQRLQLYPLVNLFNTNLKILKQGDKKALFEKIKTDNIAEINFNQKEKQLQKKLELEKTIYTFLSIDISYSKEFYYKHKGLETGVIVVLFLICTLLQVYKFIPTNIKYLDFVFFKIGSFGFPNFSIFLWVFAVKIGVVICLIIWFVFQNLWWKYTLLSPIIFVIYQLIEVFSSSSSIDDNSFWRALPIITPLLIIIIYSAYKLKYYNLNVSLQEQLKQEIDQIINEIVKEKNQNFQDRLQLLIKNQEQYSAPDYLKQLILLQQELSKTRP
ncbi:hypothetical protein ACG2LH_07640 [Zhouia sp. PK063]|uniref:hypothetical protein n=1 Tax=Zhouia sp. PK063 TaxID=3373602 RepID=UPI0037A19FD0